MKYQPPFMKPSNPDPDAPYVNGDPTAGIKGSIIPAEAIEFTQREVTNCIEMGGFVPADDDMFQLTRGVRGARFSWAQDTGSVNSMSVALDPPLKAYAQGLEIRVMCAYDNTGATTIRVNGLITQNVIRKDGSPLIAGDLRQNGIAVLVHDGANFQLVSGVSGAITIGGAGWFNGADYIIDTGPANALAGVPPVAPSDYAAGQGFTVRVKNTNTGPITLNVTGASGSALGPRDVVLPHDRPLDAGDIVPNQLIRVVYDGTKFTMLSPIFMEIIDTAMTYVVGPGGAGATPAVADFTDLIKSMRWLGRRRIGANGSVTFALQGKTGGALVHPYTSGVTIDHPDGERLIITGPAMNYTPTPGNFALSGLGGIYSNIATNTAMLRAAFQTELRFNCPTGLFVAGEARVALKKVLVTGRGESSGATGSGINVSGYLSIDTVASAGWGSCCWYISPNATLTGSNFYGVGSGLFNVGLAHSSNLLIGGQAPNDNFIIAGAFSDGLQAAHGAVIQIDCVAARPRIYECQGRGINHWGASSVHAFGIVVYYVGGIGICGVSATTWVPSSSVVHASQGYLTSMGGDMDASSTATGDCPSGDYIASAGGFMYAAAFQNGGAQFSPARNTDGNGNAHISG